MYYWIFYRRLADYHGLPPSRDPLPPVSVVICAHDERHGLESHLPAILEQHYPCFEVVVVNDQSSDDTMMVLTHLQQKYPHLVVRHLQNSSSLLKGKKHALTIGMRAATYDHVVLTDADCAPSSNYWLRDMASGFQSGVDIVLGYAPYRKVTGWKNRFIRYETVLTAANYLSFALAKIPFMGVGRNLAYRKQIFFAHNIYGKYPHLIGGDDDLLVNAAATAHNTAVQIAPSSFMYSSEKETWDEYWHQKQRHVSTARYYRWKHRLLLIIPPLLAISTYAGLLVLLTTTWWLEGLLLYGLRTAVHSVSFRVICKKLCEEDLRKWLPVMDLVFLFYYLKLIPASFFRSPRQWHHPAPRKTR